MTEDDFRANPPRPGDKVWLGPFEVVATDNSAGNVPGGFSIRSTSKASHYFRPADIDRIERAPRVPVVGDRVRRKSTGSVGTVLSTSKYHAWLSLDRLPNDFEPTTAVLSDLQVIEP